MIKYLHIKLLGRRKKYVKLCIFADIHYIDKKYRTQYTSQNDLKWLKEDLKINKNKNIIIFSHFGIAEDNNIKNNYWYYTQDGENLMLRNRNELKEIMKDKNIIAIFCGHQHWTKQINENGFDYYMIESIVENINDDVIPDGVYFEVEIDNNNVNVIEKHLTLNK